MNSSAETGRKEDWQLPPVSRYFRLTATRIYRSEAAFRTVTQATSWIDPSHLLNRHDRRCAPVIARSPSLSGCDQHGMRLAIRGAHNSDLSAQQSLIKQSVIALPGRDQKSGTMSALWRSTARRMSSTRAWRWGPVWQVGKSCRPIGTDLRSVNSGGSKSVFSRIRYSIALHGAEIDVRFPFRVARRGRRDAASHS